VFLKVAVFGLGYVGLVSAACLASKGHDVCGVDISAKKLAMISSGQSPIIEPGLQELVAAAVANGSLRTTSEPSEAVNGAAVSLVCVGTPSTSQGASDLSHVQRAVEQIGESLRSVQVPSGFHSVVVRSTVPPGTVDGLITNSLKSAVSESTLNEFGAAMCPEFLREGSGVADFFSPPFTVVGTDDDRLAITMRELFLFLDKPPRIVEARIAEALKFACNAFHATKVTFANELARVFQPLGVDSRKVMELFCEDTQLNISTAYLRPGFAFGGPCLPKDLRALLDMARVNSVDAPLLSGAIISNAIPIADVVGRVVRGSGRRVALLGLSFKASSDDLRESPNVELAEILVGRGFQVKIFDPIVKPSLLIGTNQDFVESRLPHLQDFLADSAAGALFDSDVAIVSSSDQAVIDALTDNPPPRTIDLVGRLGKDIESLDGYEGIGW
jgi:nucleotide sugar dehydrogenase